MGNTVREESRKWRITLTNEFGKATTVSVRGKTLSHAIRNAFDWALNMYGVPRDGIENIHTERER